MPKARPAVGVLLLQLGTPDAPDTTSVRRYLREFLSDERVIDLPRALWLPLLHGIILNTRPRKSAQLYRKVWTPEGSPLLVISRAQAAGLTTRLNADPSQAPVVVRVAMRYGQPSLAAALDEFQAAGIDRILAFPMYPQYAGATTGSSLEQLFGDAGARRVVPSVRVVAPYFDHDDYIDALATTIEARLDSQDLPDTLLLSFHGLPKRYATDGDPYPEHCYATAEALTRRLGWDNGRVRVTFQSRFGREEWLKPYTIEAFEELGRAGKRIMVACPGFTADCLETLEEIGMGGREQFMERGGQSFTQVPCLNDADVWLDVMARMADRELAGWR
jgi:protoporphyrin/coproporphyrin ferrochelatase